MVSTPSSARTRSIGCRWCPRGAQARKRALQKALKGYILSTFGASAVDVLVAFGIPVPKPRAVAAKTMADAVVKAKATREARHTMGKKQEQGDPRRRDPCQADCLIGTANRKAFTPPGPQLISES